jgi:hypothetical protein
MTNSESYRPAARSGSDASGLSSSIVPQRVIDHATVLSEMTRRGFRSLYHNSGAFGFAADADIKYIGWVGPPDPTVRPSMLPNCIPIDKPYETNLAHLAARAWREELGRRAWIMPMNHWASELEHSTNARWLATSLDHLGIEISQLHPTNTAAAVEFAGDGDREAFQSFIETILANLQSSDFAIVFPDQGSAQAVLCTLHHHCQIWWQSLSPEVVDMLGGLAKAS